MENCGDMFSTRQAQKSTIGSVMRSEQHHDFSKYLIEKYSCPDISKYMADRWYCSDDEKLMMRISETIEEICARIPDSDKETYLRQECENRNIFCLTFFRSRTRFSLNWISEQGLKMTMEDLYNEVRDYILSEGWEIGPKCAK